MKPGVDSDPSVKPSPDDTWPVPAPFSLPCDGGTLPSLPDARNAIESDPAIELDSDNLEEE